MRRSQFGLSVGAGLAFLTFAPRSDGQVQHAVRISNGSMGVPSGTLPADGWFGHSIADLGNLGPTARTSHALAIGAWRDSSKGAVWIAFLADAKQTPSDPEAGTVESLVKIAENTNGFSFPISIDARFGHSVARLGDLDGDGSIEIAIGSPQDDTGGADFGAVWIVSLNPDGTVKQKGVPSVPAAVKIASGSGGFPTGQLDVDDNFGVSLGVLPDLDGNGVPELAVGAHGDDDGVSGTETHHGAGAVYILFLQSDGTVHHFTKLSDDGTPTSPLPIGDDDLFGESVQYVGVIAKRHVLAVGAILDNSAGAVWMIPISNTGTIADTPVKIGNGVGGLPVGTLQTLDRFGHSLARLGDLDDDGVPDLAIGANNDDAAGFDAGAIYVGYLKSDLTVKSFYKISENMSGFSGTLDDQDHFAMVAPVSDFDGNGIADLAVGAYADDNGTLDSGSVWLLKLNQYGHASAGSCGIVPMLTTTTPGTAASPIRFDVSDAFGGPGFVALLAGTEKVSLPMGGGCTLYVLPILPVITLPLGGSGCGNGFVTLATTIPPGLGGLTLSFQAFAVDAGAVLGFSGTNGVTVRFVP